MGNAIFFSKRIQSRPVSLSLYRHLRHCHLTLPCCHVGKHHRYSRSKVRPGSAIHVALAELEHAVEEDGQGAGHGGDCFGWTKTATKAAELRTEIVLACPERGGSHAEGGSCD
jgi:hypothetical protein